jgi:hypothetical protein
MGNIMVRMPSYNREILRGTRWALALEGRLS